MPGEVVVDLGVSRNARGSTGRGDEDRMVPTLSEQPTAVLLLQVVDERTPLHALTLSASRITGPFPVLGYARHGLR